MSKSKTVIKISKLPRSQATNAYDLLNDVIVAIRAEPLRLDMGSWLTPADMAFSSRDRQPACGTVACVAGWTAILGSPLPTRAEVIEKGIYAWSWSSPSDRARELLVPRTLRNAVDDYNYSYDAYNDEPPAKTPAYERAMQMLRSLEDLFYTFPDSTDDTLEIGSPAYAETIITAILAFQTEYESELRGYAIDRSVQMKKKEGE